MPCQHVSSVLASVLTYILSILCQVAALVNESSGVSESLKKTLREWQRAKKAGEGSLGLRQTKLTLALGHGGIRRVEITINMLARYETSKVQHTENGFDAR
jgi:hypothetical protein